MAEKNIPTGRYHRLATVGRAAATQAARQAGTRAANVARSDEQATAALEKRHIDPEHILGRRMEVLVLSVLGQLRTRTNWHRIAREWIYGDAAVTELGRQEAEFYGARSAA
jgi:hypothetical protein